MSKRQAILLLGVLMANLWSSVVQAPAFRGRPVESEAPIRRQSPVRSVGSDEDLASLGRQGASYPVVEMSGADEAALNWVKSYAQGIAKYLYKRGVNLVTYEAIADAFMQLRGQSLDQQAFVDEETKMYMQGAVQAFLDNMRLQVISKPTMDADQRGVDAWLHAHAGKIIIYLESKGTESVDYADIVQACKDLGITPLATKKVDVQQRIVQSINNSLEGETGLLPEDHMHLPAILSQLRSEGAMNVNKQRFIKTAQNLKLPKDFIARLKAMPEGMMKKALEELNAELSVKHDPMVVERALGVIVQAQQARTVLVDSAIDVIRAIAEQKSSEVEELAAFDEDKFVQDMVSYVQRNRIQAKDMDLARFKRMVQTLSLPSKIKQQMMNASQDDWDNNIKPLMLKDVYGVVSVDRVIDVIREVSVV